MPRANRYFLKGHVWHITHRCHRKQFLLKFARDRERWLHWLFEARKRFGLCVLNYIATSNHIHLLVLDRGQGEIARGMQLIAGRTAQEYNRRKGRVGAFWQDRYHATAVDTEGDLARCLVYIDLNMVRAGAVEHPREWGVSGYRELQNPPTRYRIIDTRALAELLQIRGQSELRRAHAEWVEAALREGGSERDRAWSESRAVGSQSFVTGVQLELGVSASQRTVSEIDGDGCRLHEPAAAYTANSRGEKAVLSAENTVPVEGLV